MKSSKVLLVWLVSGISLGRVAEYFVLFATPLLVYEITGRASYAGLAFAVEWLPAVIAYPFAGALVDYTGGKRLFIVAGIIRAIVVFVSLVLLFLQPDWAVSVLMLNAAAISVLNAPNRMSVEKLIPSIAPEEHLAVVQSTVQNSELLALTLGPALAGILVELISKEYILILSGVLFIVSSAPVLMVTADRVKASGTVGKIFRDMAQGWSLLSKNSALMRLGVLNFLINLSFSVTLASHVVIITGVYKMPESYYGYLMGAAGGLGLINLALIPVLLRRWDVFQLGCTGLAMIIIGLFITGIAPAYNIYFGAYILAAAGVALFNVFNRTQRIKSLEHAHIGKVMGPFYLLNLCSMPLGGFIVALFADQYGNQIIIQACALLIFLGGPLLIFGAQKAFLKIFEAKKSVSPPVLN